MQTKHYLMIIKAGSQIEIIGPFKNVVEQDFFLTRWILLNREDKVIELNVINNDIECDTGVLIEYQDDYSMDTLMGAPVVVTNKSEEALRTPHEITSVHQGGAYDIEVTNLKTNEPFLTTILHVGLVHTDFTEFKEKMAEQRSKIAAQISEGVDGVGLTIENHVENKGTKCPYCESSDLQGKTPRTTINTRIAMPVKCNDCGREWEDTYELTGYLPNKKESIMKH